MFRTSPTHLLSNAVSSARCMHNLFRPLGSGIWQNIERTTTSAGSGRALFERL